MAALQQEAPDSGATTDFRRTALRLILVSNRVAIPTESGAHRAGGLEVQNGNLVVSLPSGRFTAVYYKAAGRPNLILRERTRTDDDELLAEAFLAAVAKAHELGWIV
jgi:hypothetical protein